MNPSLGALQLNFYKKLLGVKAITGKEETIREVQCAQLRSPGDDIKKGGHDQQRGSWAVKKGWTLSLGSFHAAPPTPKVKEDTFISCLKLLL